MKIELKNPVRVFKPRADRDIEISDLGTIKLSADEMITFLSETDKKYDFVAKDWGFYATPSVNSRLKNEGFKTALVKNLSGQVYVMVVDTEKMSDFEKYCEVEEQVVIEWLDERSIKNDNNV